MGHGQISQQVQIQMLSGLERSIVIDRGKMQGIEVADVATFIHTIEQTTNGQTTQRKELLGQARAILVLPRQSAWYFIREPGNNRIEVGTWVEMIALKDALQGRARPSLLYDKRTILPQDQAKYMTEKIEIHSSTKGHDIAKKERKYREVAIPLWEGDEGRQKYDKLLFGLAEWREDEEDPGVFLARPLVTAPPQEEERQSIDKKRHSEVVKNFVDHNNGNTGPSEGPRVEEVPPKRGCGLYRTGRSKIGQSPRIIWVLM